MSLLNIFLGVFLSFLVCSLIGNTRTATVKNFARCTIPDLKNYQIDFSCDCGQSVIGTEYRMIAENGTVLDTPAKFTSYNCQSSPNSRCTPINCFVPVYNNNHSSNSLSRRIHYLVVTVACVNKTSIVRSVPGRLEE
ncbi:hypothetical protein CHUAL_005635 [Chamberlinius hualienensis]